MRIGFDISQTGRGKAGCGYVAASFIQHLAEIDHHNDYLLFPTFGDFFWDPNWQQSTVQPQSPNFRRALGHNSRDEACRFWRQPDAEFESAFGDLDIIHSNNYFCPRGLKQAKLVYTLYDLSFLEQPDWTTEANRLGCFTGVFQASLYAHLIVSISEHTRQHFLATFPHFPADRIEVIHLASRYHDPSLAPQPPALAALARQGFWLSVGTIEPRKNHLQLLNAYARLKAQGRPRLPLVLAGGEGWLMQDFAGEIAIRGLQSDVLVTGYVDDLELKWLYQNCFALVYPSLWEGFGLPLVEAMSQAAPVITSNGSSLREIAGSAAILVDPLDDAQLAAAMTRLLEDAAYRRFLCDQSLNRAKDFSWAASARKLLDCYQRLVPATRRMTLAYAGHS